MGICKETESLDRIDVNGDYSKYNCRWASIETQANNCRRTIYYEHDGSKLSETQWARKLNISRNKFMWWARKFGIKWVIEHLDKIKKTKTGMSDSDYLAIGIDLPDKKYRH
jgi:hypothetical protein